MSNIAAAIEEVKALIGENLQTSRAQRDLHSKDEGPYEPILPDAVAFPQSTEQVAEIVKICGRHGCPIIPWGVGTSLEGHTLAIKGGITMSFVNMNKVIEVKPEDLQVRVQPGITREELNEDLRATGLFFPIDPGANATIGGMAATRASGTMAVRYGTMKDNVLGLEVVLADGRIIRTGSSAKKSSTGYDLTRLMIGSEGTLGIITEITLALQGQPDAVSAAVCDFPDVKSAVDSVIMAVQMGLPAARMELLDEFSIRAINTYSELDYPEKVHLFMEFQGSAASVEEQAETMREIADDNNGGTFIWTTKTEERSKLWAARHNYYYAAMAMRPGTRGMSTDICVPISQLAKAITDTQQDLLDHNVETGLMGHVGDGNYHTLLFAHPEKPEELELNKTLANRMAERALAIGGTVSGEHGIGLGKQSLMQAEHGEAWSVMADIKRAMDPQNILNPGKVVQVN